MTSYGLAAVVAAVATTALIAMPAAIVEGATKSKPAPTTKIIHGQPQQNALTGPSPAIIGGIDTQATHALVLEAETAAVLLDKGAEDRIPPASMSKVMTAYVVFSMLKEGRAKLEDELPVTERAWRTGGSKMFVPLGGRIKIGDLLRGMIVQSGNDACVVLAEGLGGSEAAFIELMNAKAKEIGLTGSHFANVDGLPSPDHYMTARDLATLALRTIKDFPEYYHYYSEKEFGFNNITQGNRNPLLYKELGADGLKTGHTDEAGYSLLASLKRDKRRIILVLSGLPTMKARAQEGERLAEWAFREFNNYQLFSAGDKVDDAEVWLGTEPKVPITVEKDVVVTLPRKSRKEMKVTASYSKPFPAPVRKGQTVGKLVVMAPETAAVEVPLVAAANVDRMGPIGRIAMEAAHLIWGNRR